MFFAGGKVPQHNHRGKSRKNGPCGIRNGMNGDDDDEQVGAVPPHDVVAAFSNDDKKSAEIRSDDKLPKGTDTSADTER